MSQDLFIFTWLYGLLFVCDIRIIERQSISSFEAIARGFEPAKLSYDDANNVSVKPLNYVISLFIG